MFKSGDNVYLVDNGRWQNNQEIVIIKRNFVNYTDNSHQHLVFDGESSLTIQSWAVSPSIEDATKFAVTYLIMLNELGLEVNNINTKIEYERIEKNYPHLIFKYMDKVVESI